MKNIHPLVGLITVITSASCWLYLLVLQFDTSDSVSLHFPRDIDDLKYLAQKVQVLKEKNFKLVCLLFCSAYIYKQAFAIPGSVFMNLLAGALFGWQRAFPLVCVLTGVGATSCYLLSNAFGRQFLMRKFSDKITTLQCKVNNNKDRLFFFLLSARLFPMSPNWFLNMASPVIGVPVGIFCLSAFLGLLPYNFICVQAGSILSSLMSMEDVLSFSAVLGMLAIAVVALLPSLFVRRFAPRSTA